MELQLHSSQQKTKRVLVNWSESCVKQNKKFHQNWHKWVLSAVAAVVAVAVVDTAVVVVVEVSVEEVVQEATTSVWAVVVAAVVGKQKIENNILSSLL